MVVNLIPIIIPFVFLGILWAAYKIEARFRALRKQGEQRRLLETVQEALIDGTEEAEEVNRAYREEEKRRFLGSVAKVNELMAGKKPESKKGLTIRLESKTRAIGCPVCLEDLVVEGKGYYDGWDERVELLKIYRCTECNSAAHIECIVEMVGGKCPTLGCGKRMRMRV